MKLSRNLTKGETYKTENGHEFIFIEELDDSLSLKPLNSESFALDAEGCALFPLDVKLFTHKKTI